MNPRQNRAVMARRASVLLGATRKMRSRPCASLAATQGSASSGNRSGVMSPQPPAAAKSVAKRSTPYRSTGFQYVITTVATPVAATASTVRSTCAVVEPDRNAMSCDRAMIGPSSTGSLYGRPISTASTPPSTSAVSAAMPRSGVGKQAGRYPMRAARPSALQAANVSLSRLGATVVAADAITVASSGRVRLEVEPLCCGVDIFVAATRKAHQHHGVRPELATYVQCAGECVRTFDRRNDAFGASEQTERVHCLGVGDRLVGNAAGLGQPRVLGADPRVIEPGRDRV